MHDAVQRRAHNLASVSADQNLLALFALKCEAIHIIRFADHATKRMVVPTASGPAGVPCDGSLFGSTSIVTGNEFTRTQLGEGLTPASFRVTIA